MEETKDHDTLIELKTMVGMLIKEVKELKDGTFKNISDHEERITKLEISKTRLNVAMGIYIAIGAFLVTLMVYHIIK